MNTFKSIKWFIVTLALTFSTAQVVHAEYCNAECEKSIRDLGNKLITCSQHLGGNQCRHVGRCLEVLNWLPNYTSLNPTRMCDWMLFLHRSNMNRRCGESIVGKSFDLMNKETVWESWDQNVPTPGCFL